MFKVLLHRGLNRRQIAEAMDVSMPAVTRHVKWLLEKELVDSGHVRVPGMKRPVEVLRPRGNAGYGLAVLVHPNRLEAEVIDNAAMCVTRREVPLEVPDQAHAMSALRQVGAWYGESVPDASPLETVGASIAGYVEPSSGMVFAVHGFENWRPCLPAQIIETIQGGFVPWTRVASMVHGLSARLGIDDRIGFLDFNRGQLSVASMSHGRTDFGRFGTASAAAHREVSGSERRCYCGRAGCLADHLDHGDATPEMVRAAIPHLVAEMNVSVLGLHVDGGGESIDALADGPTRLIAVDDAQSLAWEGLRIATARLITRRLVGSLRPAPPTPFLDPQTLKVSAVTTA
jgi:DNA-binding transcriptional ArsR family regulator